MILPICHHATHCCNLEAVTLASPQLASNVSFCHHATHGCNLTAINCHEGPPAAIHVACSQHLDSRAGFPTICPVHRPRRALPIGYGMALRRGHDSIGSAVCRHRSLATHTPLVRGCELSAAASSPLACHSLPAGLQCRGAGFHPHSRAPWMHGSGFCWLHTWTQTLRRTS